MKIAIIAPGGFDRSGTERVIPCLLWLVERLTRKGHDVHVFALRQEDKPASWDLFGARVHTAGSRKTGFQFIRQIRAQHRARPFDVIHAFWAVSPGFYGAIASTILGVPLVLSMPGGDVSALGDIGFGVQLRWRSRMLFKIATRRARKINVPSHFMQDLCRERGIESEYIPLGVALDRWPARAPASRNQDAPLRLLHVATLNQVKDQRTLLDAMALLKQRGVNFTVDMVGWDHLGGEIQAYASARDLLLCVTFHGQMKHADMRDLFERADALIMSSRHEAGPMVALEAAIAGLPVIGTAVGHFADMAPDAAMAVPVRDAQAMADAVVLLARDEQKRFDLARRAQIYALARDADYTADAMERAYRECCAAPDEFERAGIGALPWPKG